VQDIGASLEDSKSVGSQWEQLQKPYLAWAVFCGVFLAFLQQWTGCNAVNSYAQNVLQKAGFSVADSSTQAIYIGVSKLFFVIVAFALVDRLGRRPLLIVGSAGMGLSLLVLGAMLQWPGWSPYVSAVALFSYMGFFECSLGPILWIMLSELYPLSVKGLAMAFGSTSCWLFTVMVVFLFPLLQDAIGTAGVFFIFAGMCVVSLTFIAVYMPETKGKSLEEIEQMLKEGRVH
jgi:MFS family permease